MSDGFQFDKDANGLVTLTHGDYSASTTLVTREVFRASDISSVVVEFGAPAVVLQFGSARSLRLGHGAGQEADGIFWAQRIGTVYPGDVVGDDAAKLAALADALVALM